MDFWTWYAWQESTEEEWGRKDMRQPYIEEGRRHFLSLFNRPDHHFGDCTNHAISCGFCHAEQFLKEYREYFFAPKMAGGAVNIVPDPCVVTLPIQ